VQAKYKAFRFSKILFARAGIPQLKAGYSFLFILLTLSLEGKQ